jgi:hypothetical protein
MWKIKLPKGLKRDIWCSQCGKHAGNCLLGGHSDDAVSKHLWNVGKFLQQYSRRQTSHPLTVTAHEKWLQTKVADINDISILSNILRFYTSFS